MGYCGRPQQILDIQPENFMNRVMKSCVTAIAATMLMAACVGSPTQRTAGETVDDSTLLARVKTALVSNDATKARQIDVEVYRGDVQLNGFVDSEAAKAAANTTAKGVDGVASVRNNLQIRAAERSAGQVIDDGVMLAKVKSALIGDSRTKANQIEVAVNAGVVQLGGFVNSAASKAAAGEVAGSVSDVKSVENQLQIRK
jgi:hyperosmotically inducible periplasmic protein